MLYTWLNDNGYATPAKAKPLLQSHIDKGDVFVAVKLQNGQGVQAIRPTTLERARLAESTLGENWTVMHPAWVLCRRDGMQR